jgi:hypothetical protein
MTVPTNNSRPYLPYQPNQSLPNNERFGLLDKRPPTAAMFDAEFNALTDDVNKLAQAINDVQAGAISGSSAEVNAGKVLKTDGAGNLSWVLVTEAQIEEGAVTTKKLDDQAVTTAKIGNGVVTVDKIANNSITTNKLFDESVTSAKISGYAITEGKIAANAVTNTKIAANAVTTIKIADNAITEGKIAANAVATIKIADGAVTTAKILDANITTAKIANVSVTASKINSQGAEVGKVLTSGAESEAIWSAIPTTGKILQLVPLVYTHNTLNEYDALCSPTNLLSFKSGPFALTVTPLKSGNESTILIYYALTLGGKASSGGDCAVTLCKNASIFLAGSKDVTHFCSYNGNLNSDAVFTCANLFTDNTKTSGTLITYELKKALPYTNINSSYSGGDYGSFVSTMIVVEVQI